MIALICNFRYRALTGVFPVTGFYFDDYVVPERKPRSGKILDCGFWIQKRK